MPYVVMPWLGEHVELPEDPTAEQLAADLVKVGLEEEAIHSSGITGPLVVGRVLEVSPEPQRNGKVINWCQLDTGERTEDGEVAARGVICGAHNFAPGDAVVVALPGAVLPGDFVIASRKTYGHVSNGMICSAEEAVSATTRATPVTASSCSRRPRSSRRTRRRRPPRAATRSGFSGWRTRSSRST